MHVIWELILLNTIILQTLWEWFHKFFRKHLIIVIWQIFKWQVLTCLVFNISCYVSRPNIPLLIFSKRQCNILIAAAWRINFLTFVWSDGLRKALVAYYLPIFNKQPMKRVPVLFSNLIGSQTRARLFLRQDT